MATGRLGSETPRIWTRPLRALTPETSLGFAVIAFAEAIGVELYPWQRWLLIHLLELLPSGRLRFRTVVIIVGRQNGKSTVMKVLALWFLYIRGVTLILGTAQDLETAEDLWEDAVAIAESDEDLAGEISHVHRTNGQKALVLHSGSTYRVKAANRRAGRGKSARVVILDELREHTDWEAWAAISNTTLAQEEAMVIAPSNAGDLRSVVLRSLRRLAHLLLGDPDGVFADAEPVDAPEDVGDLDDDLGIFEWSTPPGMDMWNRDGWAMANPSMNYVTRQGRNAFPESNVASAARAAMANPEARLKFTNEVLCQWSDGVLEGPFPPGAWAAGVDVDSTIPDAADVLYGVDVSADRTTSYVGVAGQRADGLWHVEVVAMRAGTEWVLDWFADRASLEHPMKVAVQARGAPASSLIDGLRQVEGVEVVEWGGVDLGNATAWIFDQVKASRPADPDRPDDVGAGLRHLPQPALDVPAAMAIPKMLTDGGMAWDRVRSPVDIAGLVAVTAALWLGLRAPEAKPFRSAYEDHGLTVV